MIHNNLHYLAATITFGVQVGWGLSGPSSLALALKIPGPGLLCLDPARIEDPCHSVGCQSIPGAVLLRRAQNLPVYVLRPDGALK